MNNPKERFLRKTIPIGKLEAARIRSDENASLLYDLIEARELVIKLEAQAEAQARSPLSTSREEYLRLLPGDPEYEIASVEFDPSLYQGDVKFISPV